MITDEERREAIENLRCLSYMNRVRYKEEFYELLDETVMEPDTGYHEMNDVFERIADLIDRPTCRNNGNHNDRHFWYSACGYEAWTYDDSGCDPSDFSFCPECGAVVLNAD